MDARTVGLKQTLDLRHTIRKCPQCGVRYSPESAFCRSTGRR
jgi:uncharacterized OB-fold protein